MYTYFTAITFIFFVSIWHFFFQQHHVYIVAVILLLSSGGLRTTEFSIAAVIGIGLYSFSTFGVATEEELDLFEPVTNTGFFDDNALGSGGAGGGGLNNALVVGGAGVGVAGWTGVIWGKKY